MIRKMDEELKAKLEERVKEEIMVAAEPGKKMTNERVQKVGITMLKEENAEHPENDDETRRTPPRRRERRRKTSNSNSNLRKYEEP
ncbi:unnamed protein product [Microthlaspi erraticum]|uniref:Uncharacterized protein n=1 Tax=Microthlaspi erraticum TaxID=1685480 RepID=A0A6D2I9H3_9BRAS|nr:unnamed protein product [Microthlaspi erraticum]